MPGPLRNPNSRRAQQEIRRRQRLTAAEARWIENGAPVPIPENLPTCDPKLPRGVREIYTNLVIELTDSGVPIKQADAYAVTMAARCLYSVEEAERIAAEESDARLRIQALQLAAQQVKDLQTGFR